MCVKIILISELDQHRKYDIIKLYLEGHGSDGCKAYISSVPDFRPYYDKIWRTLVKGGRNLKIKQIKKMALENENGAYYCNTKKGILIADGSESPIESCCVIWKNDDKFYGAYAGSSDADNPLKFPKSEICFGGTPEFLKVKINGKICKASHFILLIRSQSTASRYCGLCWIQVNKDFGGYICATKKDISAVQAHLVDIYNSVETPQSGEIIMTSNYGQRYRCVNEPITIEIGGEN